MTDDSVVMRDSPEAAKPHTMSGWLSRNGYFYRDESTARYDGCTHVACQDCGKPTPKGYLSCRACIDIRDEAAYEKMERAEWDGAAMIYSLTKEKYYTDPSDAADDLEGDETLASLRLVVCEPNYARQIDNDYFVDDMDPDCEGDLPSVVAEAVDAFNKAVAGVILSWSPGKKALKEPAPNV